MSEPMIRQTYFNSYTGQWDEYWVPVAPVMPVMPPPAPVYYPPVPQPRRSASAAVFWTFTLIGVVGAILSATQGAVAGVLIALLGGVAFGGWMAFCMRHPVAAAVVVGATTAYTVMHHQHPDGSVSSAAQSFAQQQVYGPR